MGDVMAKSELIWSQLINDRDGLEEWLTRLNGNGKITLRQKSAVKSAINQFLPCVINVWQGTPKGVTYFKVKEGLQVKVTTRARVYIQYSVVMDS